MNQVLSIFSILVSLLNAIWLWQRDQVPEITLTVRLRDAWAIYQCRASFTLPGEGNFSDETSFAASNHLNPGPSSKHLFFHCVVDEEKCVGCPRRQLYREVTRCITGSEVEGPYSTDGYLKGAVIDDLDLKHLRIGAIEERGYGKVRSISENDSPGVVEAQSQGEDCYWINHEENLTSEVSSLNSKEEEV